MSPSPKLVKIIITLLWSFIATLTIGAIIVLSISTNVSNNNESLGNHNGWWLIGQNGLGTILRGFKANKSAIWFYKGGELSTFNDVVSMFANILIIVVPILSIIFTLLHIRLVKAVKYPKSIPFVDTIIRRRRAYKKSRRKIRRGHRKVKKGKMSQKELDSIILYWKQEKMAADEGYAKELAIWKEQKTHKDEIYYFFQFNRKRHTSQQLEK